jgi:hypothetical protein
MCSRLPDGPDSPRSRPQQEQTDYDPSENVQLAFHGWATISEFTAHELLAPGGVREPARLLFDRPSVEIEVPRAAPR